MKPFYQPLLAISLLEPKVPTTDENILKAMESLRYPVWATLKMDGIRAVRLDGTLKSRTRKPIPNKLIVQRSLIMPGGFDVELWNPAIEFNDISGIVRTQNSTPEEAEKIQFHVLDWYSEGEYCIRMNEIGKVIADMPEYVKFISPVICRDAENLFKLFITTEAEQGEGICFRSPISPYPQKYPRENRSTLEEQYLVKLTRFVYEEAMIIGFEEQMENGNADKRNAAGKMKRQTNQENMYGKGMVGAYLVEQRDGDGDTFSFKVPASHNDFLRREVWQNQDKYLGRTLRFKHKPHGKLNRPRSPIWEGFREE